MFIFSVFSKAFIIKFSSFNVAFSLFYGFRSMAYPLHLFKIYVCEYSVALMDEILIISNGNECAKK